LGGESFLSPSNRQFVDAAVANLAPTFAALWLFVLLNQITVAAVVAATGRGNIFVVWLSMFRGLLATSVIQVVTAFYLAWLSANLGAWGALGIALPIIALKQLAQTSQELTQVTEELLDLMVAAIEARDPYTSGHSKRVAESSRIIAKAMGLSETQVERVEVAALMHDVGKIDERFARILAKEGRLTPDEWETMKQHPVRSAELVGMLTSLRDLVPAVRHHHENWDGTGYPDGIRGDQIPLASRIIMFADTLDAITTDRPYRKALEPIEARREFLKFRGKQFDPAICDRVVSPNVWAELFDSVRRSREESGQGPTIGRAAS
jgi:putative nucleotidyltransferase with HDIG domain